MHKAEPYATRRYNAVSPMAARLRYQSAATLLATALAIVSPSVSPCQSATTGALGGAVTDAAGAVLPNVAVTLVNSATTKRQAAVTGAGGAYSFSLLAPGTYAIQFAAAGFQTAILAAVTVNVGEAPTLDAALERGAAAEPVPCRCRISAATSSTSTFVDSKTITAVPLTTRNFTQILSMASGSAADVNNAGTLGRGTRSVNVNGNTSGDAYTLDGAFAPSAVPNPDTIAQLLPYIEDYPQSLFHMRDYVPAGMNGKVNVVPPAIDPLTPKNMALSPEDGAFVCGQFGIDVDRPLICQVSRFDPWKDPLGVIDAYRQVKEGMPEVQLALVGSMASDDPEGWDFFNATVAHADGDADIHILNNFNNVGAIEVNAFQSHADVLIQKSTREGFGLTVAEAIWKARPFVGGNVGGIPLQIEDGVTGFLVSSAEQCAERTLEILKDPALGKFLGRRGKEHVRAHFLMPRYLRDYLKIFNELRES